MKTCSAKNSGPMQWRDEGFIIGVRRHGESSALLEVMTRTHGRHLGLVRGGAGRAIRAALQPGNDVDALWRARLDDQLGTFVVEPLRARAASLIDHSHALHGVGHLCALLRLLPERDPHSEIFEMTRAIAEVLLIKERAPALLAHFEIALLGAGLRPRSRRLRAHRRARRSRLCVAEERTRRVARGRRALAGELLAFPAFLQAGPSAPSPSGEELAEAFRLTGHFLRRDVFEPRGAPCRMRASSISKP